MYMNVVYSILLSMKKTKFAAVLNTLDLNQTK